MSPRVGRSGPLTRDRIVTAAIEVADELGLEAMTMKRVALHLGAGVMSLYRHVADKDELITAMVEDVTADTSYRERAAANWREAMHALARHDLDAFLRHPWMLTATATPAPPFGLSSLTTMEWALSALDELGLPTLSAGRAILTINNYVHGSARVALGAAQHSPDDSDPASDDPGRNWQQRLAGVDLDALPRLRALITDELPPDERDWFADGLDVILDGIAAGADTAERRA
ncbi:TetR/AcrR family transcriptional regulator [Brachybacterium sp. GCM10030267]|uniref:TetR/AcrR family transcriptional regulator n=1 Tax=unclassified Brachybacterium TaxID=2623841 RepID=UPI00362415E2